MGSLETRNKHVVRIDAVQRLAMWHCFSGTTPYLRVAEYPKSGGTWLGQILSMYLGVDFPRNRRPKLLNRQPYLLHGHHLHKDHVRNVVCILRDGRDVMTSAYYHMLQHHRSTHQNDPVLQSLPSSDYRDVKQNMPAFIEYMFTRPTLGGARFTKGKVSWRVFTESWLEQNANLVKYEDMLADVPTALTPVLGRITGSEPDTVRLREVADHFSFSNQTNRTPGQEDANSFLRKGVSGDWGNKFSIEACEVFKHFAGDTLIRAGYEKDMNWSVDEDEFQHDLAQADKNLVNSN